MIIWGKSRVKYLGLVSLGNDYRWDWTYKSGNDNRRTQDPYQIIVSRRARKMRVTVTYSG
jgi:hypothetical protein